MATVKLTVSKKAKNGLSQTATLTGKVAGKSVEMYASNGNSTWTDYGLSEKKVGDTFDVEDDEIRLSNQGRHYLQRSTAGTSDKIATQIMAEAKIQQAQRIRSEQPA